MLGSIEGESFNDDALFGSGLGTWNQTPETDLRLQGRTTGLGLGTNSEMVHPRFPLLEQGTENSPPREINLRSERSSTSPSSSQQRTSFNNIQLVPQQELNVAMEPRDTGVRNKTTKNKENNIKNVNRRRQNAGVNECDHRNRELESEASGSWAPVLQYKKHNTDQVDRRSKNSIKEKKQSKNSSIAQGRSDDPPVVNGCDASTSMLVQNGINPVEHPRNISTIYVKHQPNTHSPSPHLHEDRVDSNDFSLAQDESIEDSIVGETGRKVVEGRETIQHIHNDLWGRKKSNTSSNSLPSLDFSSIQTDLDTDNVPNRSPSVLQAPGVSIGQATRSSQGLIQSPIVVRYGTEPNLQYNNGQVSPAVSLHNSLTLSMDSTNGQRSPGIIQEDYSLPSDIPSSLYFGDGNDDHLFAQKLQRHYDREHVQELRLEQAEGGMDIGPDQLYYHTDSLHTDSLQPEHQPTPEPDEPRPAHTVTVDRVHNDLYEPADTEHTHNILVPLEFESPVELAEDSIISEYLDLPQPDCPLEILDDGRPQEEYYHHHTLAGPALQEAEGRSYDYGVQEVSCQGPPQLDDEEFARQLQEQLNLDSDEQYARLLQNMEDDGRYRDRYRDRHREPTTHQPLHSRMGHVWSRPLRVGGNVHDGGQNVRDSRPRSRGTWDRPLQRQTARYGGNQFAFLDNIHDMPEREGYDIPPGGDPYYRYEYDPDNMLDDQREEYDNLVSINRDPHMLASLLMVRAPDMMVPNDIDLNDYEALWDLAEGLGEVRRVGMEQTEISLLPVHTYQPAANADSASSKTDCLVCLSTFAQGEQLRTLPCCHIYHVDCIDEWLKRNAICPVCRQSAKQGEH